MPFATRQGIIDFPKKKHILKEIKEENICDDKKTPESKIMWTSASSNARKAFHNSAVITGRLKELQQLTDFLLTSLNNQTSGSMYISGLPGTGKTASVNYIIEKNELNKKYHVVKINCTAFNSSNAVFKRICGELKLSNSTKTEKEAIVAIEKYILKKHKMILLILDEMDQLESKTYHVLYKIFEWPSWENAKFVLIGIANAVDLTDRNLPRLCAKIELKPLLLHFAPYTKLEITEILKNRLIEAGVDKIFAPGGIELIAAKIAGTSGDIRRALDLGKRVVEIAELNNQKINDNDTNSPVKEDNSDSVNSLKRKLKDSFNMKSPSKLEYLASEIVDSVQYSDISPPKLLKNKNNGRAYLGEITPQKLNLSSSSLDYKLCAKSSRKELNDVQCNFENLSKSNHWEPKSLVLRGPLNDSLKNDVVFTPHKLHLDIDTKDVLAVIKNVFASSKSFKSKESTFPLHQKLLICSLLLIMKKGQKKDLNVKKLHQVYSKVCVKRGLTAVDKSGFLFLCRQVETCGVLHIGKGTGSLAKVTLQWDESEVAESLKDLNMMSSVLNDSTCLT